MIAYLPETIQSQQPTMPVNASNQPVEHTQTLQARLFNDMLDTSHALHTENNQLREFKYTAIEFIIQKGLAQDEEEAEQAIFASQAAIPRNHDIARQDSTAARIAELK